MNINIRNLLILMSGLIIGVALALGHGVFAQRSTATDARLPLNELRTFTDVFTKIKRDYVENVDDKTLLENAVRGMLTGLDPHSTYLDEEAYKELQVGTSGEFGGLGIEVGMEDGFVKVIAPIDETPADRAGVKAGDLIIRLDETPVKGMSLNDAVKIMRGKPGTDIILTIVREGAEKPLKITITRDVIQVKSVKSRILEKGFGYVRISQFQAKTGDTLIDALEKLEDENGGRLNGIVLDLRNNPGGVLNAAVAVSDAFLEKGLIVYTEGRIEDSSLRFKATPKDVLNGAPIVVLVNGGSASASEIVAGALQDHKRAVIMGTPSFGKGSVQTILPLPNNQAALKLTTARYFTPSGRSIQAEGIKPDILLERVKLAEMDQPAIGFIKESDLSGHLTQDGEENDNESQKSDKKASKTDKDNENSMLALAKRDYSLYEALNMLKGLHILAKKKVTMADNM
jgi:carboxyl-terminal processing protease